VIAGAPLRIAVRRPANPQGIFKELSKMREDILVKLEQRLGRLHARQRLGIETDHEAQVFGQGLTFFHLENWYSAPWIIRNTLKLTGLYWRARRNAERIVVKHNDISFKDLPPLFDGFTILHISDMHTARCATTSAS
jgi:hypothetical protein